MLGGISGNLLIPGRKILVSEGAGRFCGTCWGRPCSRLRAAWGTDLAGPRSQQSPWEPGRPSAPRFLNSASSALGQTACKLLGQGWHPPPRVLLPTPPGGAGDLKEPSEAADLQKRWAPLPGPEKELWPTSQAQPWAPSLALPCRDPAKLSTSRLVSPCDRQP